MFAAKLYGNKLIYQINKTIYSKSERHCNQPRIATNFIWDLSYKLWSWIKQALFDELIVLGTALCLYKMSIGSKMIGSSFLNMGMRKKRYSVQ